MSPEAIPDYIRLLAHEIRWNIVKALTRGDYQVNELVTMLGHPMNLVSYHLKLLRNEDLVRTRRSEADGRDTYYSLNLTRLHALYQLAGQAMHPALLTNDAPTIMKNSTRILFVCTHNSARSQMAEGFMRHLSHNQIDVTSAGSEPTSVHSEAIRTMNEYGIDIRQQVSKSLDSLAQQSFDYVITVCDRAREVCPTFAGNGQPVHWGFPDPLLIQDKDQRRQVFIETAQQLTVRIEHFLITLAQGA